MVELSQQAEDTLRPARRANVQWRQVGGDVLIMHALLKQYHILNSVAARIWELSDGSRTSGEIATLIAEEHSHDRAEVHRDVVETLEGLEALQLLDFKAPGEA
ncbi:MAG TPA: PqqD family protein [Thermoanaerobaculia bacterium]|nr:PqqD family protein [Thermoanaerobaculia bacterium]